MLGAAVRCSRENGLDSTFIHVLNNSPQSLNAFTDALVNASLTPLLLLLLVRHEHRCVHSCRIQAFPSSKTHWHSFARMTRSEDANAFQLPSDNVLAPKARMHAPIPAFAKPSAANLYSDYLGHSAKRIALAPKD